ncbi:MAG: chromate transporter [Clostridia bacterium]|nr:chromate transporter [Clostridia bacterium]NCC44550.1 chromate transporter [Clostridia bacterium]
MILLRLAYEFFKTGLFAVGGGLATLPFLYEMSAKTGWFTRQDILDLVAISESTPGAIGINMSTYVGFITRGPVGAIVATLALATPSIIIIILVSKVMKRFKESPVVEGVFSGLRPASTGLIVAAGLSVAQMAFLNEVSFEGFHFMDVFGWVRWEAVVLAVVMFVGLKKFKFHPIAYIFVSAVIGIIFQL